MAKYTNVTTIGPIEWAKIFENNRDMEGYKGIYKECDGAYTVNQIVSKEGYQLLVEAGSKKKPNQKRLMDGEIVIKHERKHSVPQAPTAGGQPLVLDKYSREWDVAQYGYPANGSIAEIESLVTEFDYTKPDGSKETTARTTMKSIKILEFKKWDPETKEVVDADVPPASEDWKKNQTPTAKQAIEEFAEENVVTLQAKIQPIDDDEIPF